MNREPFMNLFIRPATLSDADVIAEFNRRLALETEGKALDPAILTKGVKAMLADVNKGRYFVAEMDKHVIGQLGITLEWSDWRNGNLWWIQSVYVASEARRFGVFRKLYQHVVESARTEGHVVGIRLYVEHDNRVAQETYRKMGMVMTGYHVMEEMFTV
jgi:ribosomal protein S18 acetylase RimI-like enzyme